MVKKLDELKKKKEIYSWFITKTNFIMRVY